MQELNTLEVFANEGMITGAMCRQVLNTQLQSRAAQNRVRLVEFLFLNIPCRYYVDE